MAIQLINMLFDIIVFTIIAQLVTVIHETAHALTALIFTDNDVKISIGGNKILNTFSIKRLKIEIGNFSPFIGFVDFNSCKNSKTANIIINLAGPLISLLIGTIIYFKMKTIQADMWYINAFEFYGIYSFIQGIITLIPIKYSNLFKNYERTLSDGYKILQCVKEI